LAKATWKTDATERSKQTQQLLAWLVIADNPAEDPVTILP
jgi:hypothetical protein